MEYLGDDFAVRLHLQLEKFYAEQGVNLQDIAKFGLWRSNVIDAYLKTASFKDSSLYGFLKKL